jgi:hypothetical protein
MTDSSENDPWADLYADLGVTEKPATKSNHATPEPIDFINADDEEDDGDDTEVEGMVLGEGESEDEPGTKKRRRRRRRRSKKKPEGTLNADGTTTEANEDAGEPTLTSEADEETSIDDSAYEDEEEPAKTLEPVLEGATNEMTRELIANWNVPSWEEIVTSLYRPNH